MFHGRSRAVPPSPLTLNRRARISGHLARVMAATLAIGLLGSGMVAAPAGAVGNLPPVIGGLDGDSDTSTVATALVDVTPVNDAPTLSATGLVPTFTEGGSAVALFSGTAISTVESGQSIGELKLTVAGLADGADEKLIVSGATFNLNDGAAGVIGGGSVVSYSVSVGGTTATVTLTGTFTPAQAQALVDTIAYRNTSQNPSTHDRTIKLVSISDNGGADTTVLSVAATVHVTPVNDAPTLSGGPSVLPDTDENTASSGMLISVLLADVVYADADGPASGIAVTASSGNGIWQYSTEGNAWVDMGSSLTDAYALLLSASTQVRYVPDAKDGETASLTFRAWDQTVGASSTNVTRSTANATSHGGSSAFSDATAQARIDVAAVNDAPTDIGLSNLQVAENTSTASAPTIGTLSTTDVDSGDSFTYGIVGGTDQDVFEISGSSLQFRVGTVLDYETQTSYAVIVRTTDAGSATYDKTFTILLTDVNEAPMVDLGIGDQSAIATLPFTFTVPADAFADPDAATTLIYTATLANGDPLPGWLDFDGTTFSGTPSLGDAGPLAVRVTASDGVFSVSDDFTLTVSIAPAVSGIVRADVSALTNAGMVKFTVTFSEAVTGVSQGDFTPTATSGSVAGNVATVATADNITYTVTVQNVTGDGTLRLDLNASGTGIQNGQGLDIIGGYTGGETYTIDQTPPVVSAPVLEAASDSGASHSDGITIVTALTLTGTAEADSNVHLYDSNGITVLGTTVADSNGNWSITSSALAEGNHSLTATATDPAGNTSSASAALVVTIDVTPPSAPTLSGTRVRSSAGQDAIVGNLAATDANGTPEFALVSGAGDSDNTLFAIVHGELTMVDPAAAGVGPRSVRVAATDLAGNSADRAFSIDVVANQPPIVSGVPTGRQWVTAGVAAELSDPVVSDGDDDTLIIVLTPTNGRIGGLAEGTFNGAVVAVTDGVWTLTGAADKITALLAELTFTAGAAGTASVTLAVDDGYVDAPSTTAYLLQVAPSQVITVQPTDALDIVPGGSAQFAVEVTDRSVIESVHWEVATSSASPESDADWQAVDGGDGYSLTVPVIVGSSAWYRAVLTGRDGVVTPSTPAHLTVWDVTVEVGADDEELAARFPNAADLQDLAPKVDLTKLPGAVSFTLPWSGQDSAVTVFSYSTPTYLDTFPVADSSVKLSDLSLSAGEHYLALVGVDSKKVTVLHYDTAADTDGTATPSASGSPSSAPTTSAGGELPMTGLSSWLLIVAAALTLLGGAMISVRVALSRRGRPS